MRRQLVLENGASFIGEGFGSSSEVNGEVVFNTGMTGYQELITDPSYCGQIVTMAYPLIGNYGINRSDNESARPSISGLIVKEVAKQPSHWQKDKTLNEWLEEYDVPGIEGIDTRRLTKMIREYGTLRGRIVSADADPKRVAETLKVWPLPSDQISRVSTKSTYVTPGPGPRVVLVDFGAKQGILRECIKRRFDVVIVPYQTTAEDIMKLNPDGVLLSNGPGDPKSVPEAIETVRHLLGKVPIFGICLGHQLFALASGANTVKMRFGHRGVNHPVKNLKSGKFVITSQNHGFTVEKKSLSGTDLEITHVAINDGTIEGLHHLKYPAFSVQYHPEASPGPDDSQDLFDAFLNMMETFKKEGAPLA
ncbi:glutamine-hydrolyzing carbamoyl-phosphate synthase small subunit [Sporolactobacillus sp. CPB3-1]|uniref:Carbamoyl phosphate synthase small chain n=1 Tax=Sporolactobacillus mangiferae TaxID=2940498 RepID=A0ABT0M8G4_9BACL|nr:glutamine-hydrolyzing carbamoyl-phosphate synthase small subunit [Sporolactobacillus mangiferae]MCL1630923.1 glutamine-hydrolyzing carbamoyl-phosphate synthase small subunit [Sporolactobacillus mangiferae]